ncbi:MAG: YdhR family protein [Aggregatilineales bacterium]
MSKTILQINYKFNSSHADHTAWVGTDAQAIAAVPGLMWKVWLMNEADREAGGIYLFESREAAQRFVSSPEMTGFAAHPLLSSFSAKMFEAVESLSKITRGPLAVAEAAKQGQSDLLAAH